MRDSSSSPRAAGSGTLVRSGFLEALECGELWVMTMKITRGWPMTRRYTKEGRIRRFGSCSSFGRSAQRAKIRSYGLRITRALFVAGEDVNLRPSSYELEPHATLVPRLAALSVQTSREPRAAPVCSPGHERRRLCAWDRYNRRPWERGSCPPMAPNRAPRGTPITRAPTLAGR